MRLSVVNHLAGQVERLGCVLEAARILILLAAQALQTPQLCVNTESNSSQACLCAGQHWHTSQRFAANLNTRAFPQDLLQQQPRASARLTVATWFTHCRSKQSILQQDWPSLCNISVRTVWCRTGTLEVGARGDAQSLANGQLSLQSSNLALKMPDDIVLLRHFIRGLRSERAGGTNPCSAASTSADSSQLKLADQSGLGEVKLRPLWREQIPKLWQHSVTS